jgi:hypothetical protein
VASEVHRSRAYEALIQAAVVLLGSRGAFLLMIGLLSCLGFMR